MSGSIDLYTDLIKYQKRLAAAQRAALRGPPSEDKNPNRKWVILQYMLDVGAFKPELGGRGVTTTEVAEAMGITPQTASTILHRLRKAGWVVKLGGHFGFWYLTQKAMRFAREWGGFLNHPWIRVREVR